MARYVSRQQLARRGVIVLVAIALAGVLVSLRSNGTFGSAPHVSAVVTDAGGALRPGSDVKMKGVIVGRVSAIDTDAESGGVSVDIELSEDDMDHVPGNVVARILPATVFGTTFVDLVVHGTPAKNTIAAGDVIEADRTQGTLELQQALDDIDRLVTALGPAELASAIGSASQALDGRGGELRRTVSTVNSYLDRLNGRMPAVRADLEALATSVNVVDRVAPDLLDATEDGLVFLSTLVSQEAALTSLISGGTDLAVTAKGFLSRNQKDLVAFINDTGAFVDVLYDNRQAGISDAIATNIAVGNALPTVVRNGFVEVDGVLGTTAGNYYGRGSRPYYGRGSLSSMVGDDQ